jgi:hypothetical protein
VKLIQVITLSRMVFFMCGLSGGERWLETPAATQRNVAGRRTEP